MAGFGRSRGISLLLPTQNAELTVEMCIRSFAGFPDEMIVVDNGSTDATKDIVRELEREYEHVTFYDAPHLKDLYENRQYALERSRFQWVARFDSDYVAHTEGPYDIRRLRDHLLSCPRSLRPWAFRITQVNLAHDYWHTGNPAPITTLPARIVQHFPGMKFARRGRWEGVRFQKLLRNSSLDRPYWFHCNFKTRRDWLFRTQRTNWRELGDFDRFPTLESYVRHVSVELYGSSDLKVAEDRCFEELILPSISRYDPEEHYPYPSILADAMQGQESDC